MKIFFKIIRIIFLFSTLTILTQVGGLIYLLYLPFSNYIKGENYSRWKSIGARFLGFSVLYLLICLFLIPPLAKKYGRVALPVYPTKEVPVKAGNVLFYLANRHYVKPELQRAYFEVAKKLAEKYPKAQLIHLDANFPFFNNFPLFPHLSHDDGEKLDIGLLYKKPNTNFFYNKTFSFTGYGVCEEPIQSIPNKPAECAEQGYWQYSFLKKITFAKVKEGYVLDTQANWFLINQLMNTPSVKKIFIEPHLVKRFRLGRHKKIRFHGCHAVRHDDHIHFQL